MMNKMVKATTTTAEATKRKENTQQEYRHFDLLTDTIVYDLIRY